MANEIQALNPCPCCGNLVFADPPGSAMSCPVCGWEDDYVQLLWPTESEGANRFSLEESQSEFSRHGSSDPQRRPRSALSNGTFARDAGWRPFDRSRDGAEPPADLRAESELSDLDQLYYWRRTMGSTRLR